MRLHSGNLDNVSPELLEPLYFTVRLFFKSSGSYNPDDWNLFGRSEDLTNNISEGLNSKIIKLLVSSHPHLNKLLYTLPLVGVMMEAEQKYLKVLRGEPPIQRKSAKYERIKDNRKKLTANYREGLIEVLFFVKEMGALSLKVSPFLFIVYF